MKMIESNTCVSFKPRNREEDYVNIYNVEGKGCMGVATIVHELLHVVGLNHEHVREDRDDYVKIHWENINKTMAYNFVKLNRSEATTYGIKYDYLSIMHYSKYAYAKWNGMITVETLDRRYQWSHIIQLQNAIGNQKEPSPSDYMKVCKIYNCNICMGKPMQDKSIVPPDCEDKDPECLQLAYDGFGCEYDYMKKNCCGTCAEIESNM
ncbi:astacin [Oesophagostomum dentatum]|uniref:Metalloendopeptidase n=1 Tax=Oesophagostomum dentatum TaxID=61180 RepID=A0A0B1T660_OESDE|nr:astacin [Oesophagostomum dentatum]